MLLIFILTHYYLIAKWHIISWCCCFGFQSLLRSPEVIRFLQQQQRLLTTQNQAQTPHNYWRCFNADTFNDIFTTAVFYTHVRTEHVIYSHPWWCGDYQHCILKTGIFDTDLIDLKVLPSSSSPFEIMKWNSS